MTILQRSNTSVLTSLVGLALSFSPQKTVMLVGVAVLIAAGMVWSYLEMAEGSNWFRKLLGAVGIVAIGTYLYVRFAFVK